MVESRTLLMDRPSDVVDAVDDPIAAATSNEVAVKFPTEAFASSLRVFRESTECEFDERCCRVLGQGGNRSPSAR